jgi:hypothetical protein
MFSILPRFRLRSSRTGTGSLPGHEAPGRFRSGRSEPLAGPSPGRSPCRLHRPSGFTPGAGHVADRSSVLEPEPSAIRGPVRNAALRLRSYLVPCSPGSFRNRINKKSPVARARLGAIATPPASRPGMGVDLSLATPLPNPRCLAASASDGLPHGKDHTVCFGSGWSLPSAPKCG